MSFKNLNDTPSNQDAIDGLWEEIHVNLRKIHELRIISRASADPFKNRINLSIRRMDIELRVNCIVEGSTQK